MRRLKIFLSLILAAMLTAAAFALVGCNMQGNGDKAGEKQGSEASHNTSEGASKDGDKTITVKVTDDKGVTTAYVITTNASNLRAALEQEKMVEGDEGDFGLYVKKVNGLRADYDLDGAYWKFTKGDTMLMTSIDSTPIYNGETFEIIYTKG